MSNRRPVIQRSVVPRASGSGRASAGFTMIELMVAMLLGLIVIGGVVSVFLANQQSYRTNQALSEVQDNSRIAFELMARDIRQAGLSGCNNNGRVANVLNDSSTTTDWWANWGNAVVGYDDTQADPAKAFGTATGYRKSGTASLMLLGTDSSGLSVASDTENSANFKINETTTDLNTGDIIIVCDPDHATIVQITNYNSSNVTVVHNTGNSVSPGNCSKGLGYPTDCSSTNGNQYVFGPNSEIAKLSAVDWYVGYNGAGGTSLFRVSVGASSTSSTPAPSPTEMVRNVTDMQIKYHVPGAASFVTASNITNWATVDSVQVTVTLQSTFQRAGSNQQALSRTFTATSTVRNRVQ